MSYLNIYLIKYLIVLGCAISTKFLQYYAFVVAYMINS